MTSYRGIKTAFAILFATLPGLLFSPGLRSQERFRRNPPPPEPLVGLNLPAIESHVLSNELTVSIVRSERAPVISIQLVINAGERLAPSTQPGLAAFTASMLMRGTASLSTSAIEDKIESLGGRLTSIVFPETTVFSFTVLEENAEAALDLLSKMVLEPQFSQREIDNVKRSMYYALLARNSDPDFIARRLLLRQLLENHPFRNISYDEDTVKNFDRNSLLRFFQAYYRPNNAEFILIGNINLQTASRLVSRYFNTWKQSPVSQPSLEPPQASERIKVCLVDSPQAKDAVIYLGNVIAPLTEREYFPVAVFNNLIGGTPTSRIFLNLRESKGFAYYAFSQFDFFKTFGIFSINARVRPEVTADSIRIILDELQETTKAPLPNSDIELAKSYLIGNFPIKIENLDDYSFRISDIRSLGLGKALWNGYYEAVMPINSERVFETIRQYKLLTPVIVVVGDKSLILDDLRDQFGEIEVCGPKGNPLSPQKPPIDEGRIP